MILTLFCVDDDTLLAPRDKFDDKAGVKSDAGRDKLTKQASTMVVVDPIEYEKDYDDADDMDLPAKGSTFKEEQKRLDSISNQGI